jgi:ArsR family metal-binding transcriptional regulator
MRIEHFEMRLEAPPWEPGSEYWSAFARLDADISAALPYLNTTLRGAVYEHSVPALFWRPGDRLICFRPREIAVSGLKDRAEAQSEIEGMVRLVNATWERRAEIEPSHLRRKRPKLLDLYKWLPRSNCGQCGQPACLTFALKLAMGQAEVDACLPLAGKEHSAERRQLLAALEGVALPG